jgi:transposase
VNKYPDVGVYETIGPIGHPGCAWPGYESYMLHQRHHLQSVAYLASDIAKQLLHLTYQRMLATMHGEEKTDFRDWTPGELAGKACDIATALYLEFQARDWLVETPRPRKLETPAPEHHPV